MLNRLSSQELINKSLIQSGELTKTSFAKKNPYADVDKDLSVDVPEISQDAIKLYQKDLDIKKFTNLALSDFDNNDCNLLVLNNVFNAEDVSFDDKIIQGIFDNKTFLRDLFG